MKIKKENALLLAMQPKIVLLTDSQRLAISQGIDIVRNDGSDISFQKTIKEFQNLIEKSNPKN